MGQLWAQEAPTTSDIVVSKETTWLTKPLADDGLPDFAAYLLEKHREGVTPENNGAVPFLQAMWPAELQNQHQKPLCDHLGMAVPEEAGFTRPQFDEELKQKIVAWFARQEVREVETDWESRAEQMLDYVAAHPWRREDCPPLAEWIDQHAPRFALLHEAARRPKFYCPSPSLIAHPRDPLLNGETPAVTGMASAGQALKVRALLHLGEGNAAAAWHDTLVMYRLGQQMPTDDVVLQLVAIGVQAHADEVTLAICDRPSLTSGVAQEILEFQKSRQLRSSMIEAIDEYERLTFVTAVLALAEVREVKSMTRKVFLDEFALDMLDGYDVDWNLVLEEGQNWHDRLVAAGKIADLRERNKAIDEFEHELANIDIGTAIGELRRGTSRKVRSAAMAKLFLSIQLPVVPATLQSEERSNSYTQLHQMAPALALHRLREGEYPESLDKLTPKYLSAPLVDLYGNPFKYERSEDGYLLYSTGLNGIDEGGSHQVYGRYAGYSVYDGDAAAREALGIPPRDESAEADDQSGLPLKDQIPEDADDWGIRLPLPRPESSISGSRPRGNDVPLHSARRLAPSGLRPPRDHLFHLRRLTGPVFSCPGTRRAAPCRPFRQVNYDKRLPLAFAHPPIWGPRSR